MQYVNVFKVIGVVHVILAFLVLVTPRPTKSTREVENPSDETEELCSSSFVPDLCDIYLELSSSNACAVLSK